MKKFFAVFVCLLCLSTFAEDNPADQASERIPDKVQLGKTYNGGFAGNSEGPGAVLLKVLNFLDKFIGDRHPNWKVTKANAEYELECEVKRR